MTRTIQDRDLQLWEVFANSGDFGSAERARMVFQCLSDPSRRAKALDRSVPRAAVEQEIGAMAQADLVDLLGQARELG